MASLTSCALIGRLARQQRSHRRKGVEVIGTSEVYFLNEKNKKKNIIFSVQRLVGTSRRHVGEKPKADGVKPGERERERLLLLL